MMEFLEAYPEVPKENWEYWKKIHVTDTSQVFVDWTKDCEKIVEEGWKLKVISIKSYLEIARIKGKEKKPFAFVEKSTGNILCPATMTGSPFEFPRGNIADPTTRLLDITPTGVRAHWEFLPTHPNYNLTNTLDLSGLNIDIVSSNTQGTSNDEG